MAKDKKLLKAGGLYFIGNIFDKAIAFVTVPIFTRMLSTSEYGTITTYLSWVSILSVFITLSLGNSIRTAEIDFSDEKDNYMSSIFALGTLSSVIMTTLICFATSFWASENTVILVFCCCIQSYSASIIQAVQWRYMMDVKYLQRTALQSLPNIAIIVLSIVFIRLLDSNKYFGRAYAYVLVYTLIAIAYLIYYFAKGHTFYNKKYWGYALAFSLPIIFHSLSTVILSQADRSMITWLRDSSETGIYGLAYQFGMVPVVVTTTFENVWIPWFTRKMEAGDKKTINKMAVPYINLVAIMCAGVMLVAPEVLKLMTTSDYYGAIYMIAPVVAATFMMFLASVSLDLEYYLKKTKTIASNTLVAAVVNIVLNFIFIPLYGGTAAAYTTAVSYVVSFLMHYIVARKLDRELFSFKIYIVPILIMAIFMLLTTLLMNFALIRWTIGVVLGSVFLVVGYKLVKVQRI